MQKLQNARSEKAECLILLFKLKGMREKLIIGAATVVLSGAFASCAKRNIESPTPVPNSSGISMTLHDKPLDTVKRYITGRWQLISAGGGFSGKDHKDYTNTFVSFTPTTMVQTENGAKTIDASITWEKVKNINTGGESYMITSPVSWKFNSLRHDSLVANDNVYDGYSFLLIRAQ